MGREMSGNMLFEPLGNTKIYEFPAEVEIVRPHRAVQYQRGVEE